MGLIAVCCTGLSEGEATGLSIDVESGMDEEASGQRRPSRFARRVEGCEPRRPPRVEALARGSGEEQHSTSEVVDIIGNSCDRRGDSSLSDRQVCGMTCASYSSLVQYCGSSCTAKVLGTFCCIHFGLHPVWCGQVPPAVRQCKEHCILCNPLHQRHYGWRWCKSVSEVLRRTLFSHIPSS